jgi:uncharacterized membrane-anchored protein YjiN (DUF445 family)
MARVTWSKDDIPSFATVEVIFVTIGAAFGLLRGDGIVIGAVAGMLLFGIVFGVGVLVEVIGRLGR